MTRNSGMNRHHQKVFDSVVAEGHRRRFHEDAKKRTLERLNSGQAKEVLAATKTVLDQAAEALPDVIQDKLQERAEQQTDPDAPFQGKKNIYTCQECGEYTITVDRDPGTTPFMTMCTMDGCRGMAQSSMYRVPQHMKPTHEWYKPDDVSGESLATQEHVRMGGLLLRPIQAKPELVHAEAKGHIQINPKFAKGNDGNFVVDAEVEAKFESPQALAEMKQRSDGISKQAAEIINEDDPAKRAMKVKALEDRLAELDASIEKASKNKIIDVLSELGDE